MSTQGEPGDVRQVVELLRAAAHREQPPEFESDAEGDAAFEDVPEITWKELWEMSALMRRAADLLESQHAQPSEAEVERLRTLLRASAVATGEQLGEWEELPTVVERKVAEVEQASAKLKALVALADRLTTAIKGPHWEGWAQPEDVEKLKASPSAPSGWQQRIAAINPCVCGHEKGDHQQRIGQRGNYTPCCVSGCSCSGFRKGQNAKDALPSAPPAEESSAGAVATFSAFLDQMEQHARDVEDPLLYDDIEVARKALKSIGEPTKFALGQDWVSRVTNSTGPEVSVIGADVTTGTPCKARRCSTPEPQDCDWPFCGCDPHATKVIEALDECGMLKGKDDPSRALPPAPEGSPAKEPATRRLAKLLESIGDVKVQFGLRQQGHFPTVERMRSVGATWDEIGKAIGWHGPTVEEFYAIEADASPAKETP